MYLSRHLFLLGRFCRVKLSVLLLGGCYPAVIYISYELRSLFLVADLHDGISGHWVTIYDD